MIQTLFEDFLNSIKLLTLFPKDLRNKIREFKSSDLHQVSYEIIQTCLNECHQVAYIIVFKLILDKICPERGLNLYL